MRTTNSVRSTLFQNPNQENMSFTYPGLHSSIQVDIRKNENNVTNFETELNKIDPATTALRIFWTNSIETATYVITKDMFSHLPLLKCLCFDFTDDVFNIQSLPETVECLITPSHSVEYDLYNLPNVKFLRTSDIHPIHAKVIPSSVELVEFYIYDDFHFEDLLNFQMNFHGKCAFRFTGDNHIGDAE